MGLNPCKLHLDQSYLGMVRFTVPTGKISIDFPQNLFFHLTSEEQICVLAPYNNFRDKKPFSEEAFSDGNYGGSLLC